MQGVTKIFLPKSCHFLDKKTIPLYNSKKSKHKIQKVLANHFEVFRNGEKIQFKIKHERILLRCGLGGYHHMPLHGLHVFDRRHTSFISLAPYVV